MACFRLERDGDTAVLTIDRPPVNAIDAAAAAELEAAFEQLEAAPPAGGLVVTGTGSHFSAGLDVKAVRAADAPTQARIVHQIDATLTRLYGLPTATVAAVNGTALGGAFVLVLACDARIGTDGDGRLGLPGVTAGVPYPACPMAILQTELEPSLRRQLVLSGTPIGPARAHAAGVLDALVPADELVPAAVALARTRAAAPVYARVKAQLRGDTLRRLHAILQDRSDPMLQTWVA